MYCLHCDWHMMIDLHGVDAHSPADRVAVRVGVLTTETSSGPVIALASDTGDEPVAIDPDVAARLVDGLQRSITHHDELLREWDAKRQETARRLVDAAVLPYRQWREVLDGITSSNAERRHAAIAAFKAAAPPRWLGDNPTG